jgi:hypothetical protein
MSPPVTPPAPWTSTVSPGLTATAASAWSAVRAGTPNAAAAAIGTPAGTTLTWSAAAMNRSAQVPAGMACVVTASPGRG